MIELVAPTTRLADSWWAMVAEFGADHVHGSGYRHADHTRLADPGAFASWVALLHSREEAGPHLEPSRVPSAYRWIVDDERVVGTIAVRWALTPALLEVGGHIGYAVAPSARRRGVASAALRQALVLAAERGIDPVLVTCEPDNVASRRTIAGAGGVLEDARSGQLRYWIRTGVGGVAAT